MIAFKIYNCTCGYKAWAMDNKEKVICKECGREVLTEKSCKYDGDTFTINLLKNKKSA